MPTHHAHGGSGDPANHPDSNDPASLSPPRSLPPPIFPLTAPGTRIRNSSLSCPQTTSDEDEDSPADHSHPRTSSGAAYVPRYAAAAHSYHPGDPSSFQHMQSRYQNYDPERQHPPPLYDPYNRLGPYAQDRPLIHFVTNEWQNHPRYHDNAEEDYYSSDEERFYSSMNKEGWVPDEIVNHLPTIRIPRRVQRWLLIYFVLIVACWFGWLYWISPAMEEERRLDDAFAAAEKKGNRFGSNVRPSFTDMPQVKTLPEHLIPGNGNRDRRLIFIGDVHGCKDELLALLEKTKYNEEKDHIIFTGDIIAKGPDSLGAVDMARELNASCVRGNHEDRVLLAWQNLHSKMHPIPYEDENIPHPNTKEGKEKLKDDREEGTGSRGDYKERLLARQFSQEQITYMQSCPVVLRVPLPKPLQSTAGEYVVAHAGLVPGVDMDRQDPFQVMNMRTIDLVSRVPSELRLFEPWEKIWGHSMGHVHPLEQRSVVVYGHDSKRGLNVKKYSKGLDSGCVKGGKLTALMVDGWGRERVVAVKCKKYKKEKEG